MDNRMKGVQQVLDRNGTILHNGKWNPRALLNILGTPKDGSWSGKTVLDIGANTGGLSLEIARQGAKVTIVEPDPLNRNIGITRDTVNGLARNEKLDIKIFSNTLFSCHELPQHDIILFLGLFYHFRYPQYCLDYISHLKPKELFISSQTYGSNDLIMLNRKNKNLLPKNHLPKDIIMAGFHQTHSMLQMMLAAAGFEDITLLTDAEYNFPFKPAEKLTNTAYYHATAAFSVNPEIEKDRFL